MAVIVAAMASARPINLPYQTRQGRRSTLYLSSCVLFRLSFVFHFRVTLLLALLYIYDGTYLTVNKLCNL